MKKKSIIIGLALAAAFMCTACGNPQAQLPEADKKVDLVEVVDEDKEGNPVEARIIKELEKSDEVYGDLISVTVYEREDNEDERTKSDLYVEVVSETEMARYTSYLALSMKYDKDSKEWKVKDIEADDDEELEVEILDSLLDDEAIKESIAYNIYSITYELDGTTGYATISGSDSITGLVTDGYELEQLSSDEYEIKCNVAFTITCGLYSYMTEGTISYDFWLPGNLYRDSEYVNYCGHDLSVTSRYMDESIAELLDEENMIDAWLETEPTNLGYNYDEYNIVEGNITKDMIVEYTTGQLIGTDSYAQREMTLTIEPVDGYVVDYKGYIEFTHDVLDDTWKYSYGSFSIAYDDDYNYMCRLTDDFVGVYDGLVIDDKDEILGDFRMDVDRVTANGQQAIGTVQFAKDGDFDKAEPVDFVCKIQSPYYMELYVDLDDKISVSRNNDIYSMYLYYDFNDECWKTSTSCQVIVSKN